MNESAANGTSGKTLHSSRAQALTLTVAYRHGLGNRRKQQRSKHQSTVSRSAYPFIPSNNSQAETRTAD